MSPPSPSRSSVPLPINSQLYLGQLGSSPIGPLWVAVSAQGLCLVEWSMSQADFVHLASHRFNAKVTYDEAYTANALHQLGEYLRGDLRDFDLPLDFSAMTPFQAKVLQLTSLIPYGKTSTYKEIAVLAGNEHAARAVGRVEATNPIPIVIPCHRVLGSDGALHGYGGPGGVKLKAWLLDLERTSC